MVSGIEKFHVIINTEIFFAVFLGVLSVNHVHMVINLQMALACLTVNYVLQV